MFPVKTTVFFFKGSPAGQQRQETEETEAGEYVIRFLTSDLCYCPDIMASLLNVHTGATVAVASLLVTQGHKGGL